eukprot:5792120-Pleurochrysis_carterae.AAC.2
MAWSRPTSLMLVHSSASQAVHHLHGEAGTYPLIAKIARTPPSARRSKQARMALLGSMSRIDSDGRRLAAYSCHCGRISGEGLHGSFIIHAMWPMIQVQWMLSLDKPCVGHPNIFLVGQNGLCAEPVTRPHRTTLNRPIHPPRRWSLAVDVALAHPIGLLQQADLVLRAVDGC